MANPHHYSVCMISAQFSAQGKGTGVLVDYAGYSCIVAGPVAASNALVHFMLPGMPHHVTISLRPEAVFEVFGKHKSIVITACDRPIFPPSIAIPPAIPAPAEYADTIQRFSRSGRLQSPTEPNISDSTDTDKMTTVPGRLTETRNTSRHEHNSRKTYSKRYRKHKPEEAASVRVRRGAVIPGTTAHRHPNDPDPVEPFAIAVEHGGVIAMELVVHQGRSKRAYRTAVLGRRVEQAPAWMEAGARAACRTEVQGVVGATEEWKGDEMVMEGGRGRGCGNTPTALPTGRQDGLPGTGRGGCHGGRNRKRRKSDGDGERRQGVGCLGGEGRNTTDGNQQNIVVVVAEEEALDGVHGAPVFVGGQLFGFAIQERVGEHVTGVIPASAFGLLPAPLDALPSIPTRLKNDLNRVASSGTPSEGEVEEMKHVGGGKGSVANAVSPPPTVLLEKMLHLFGHGTPLGLELELNRVGEEALRALRTPDGRSLVHLAAMSETVAPLGFVHRRLQMDVAFAEVPESGNTGLHLAAYCGRVECLEYLLSQGGNAAKKNHHGQTPAMLAVLTGRTEVLRWLLENTKNTAEDLRSSFPEELIGMVEDMDEAAVYGSTMYHLLEEIFSVGRPANGEESELSDNGQEDEKPADDEAKAAAAQQQPTAAAEGTAGGGEADNSIIDPDRAWELFGRGEMDARRVLAVLTRIHGEATNAWWPFVRAALPPGEPRLVEALEVAIRDAERARVEAKTTEREGAKARRAAAGIESDNFPAEETSCSPFDPGAESACLQPSTVKYLRDKISAGQFYEEMIGEMKGGGKVVEEAVIAKVARGMPEDKAWALLDAHRKWKREERLNKTRFRNSRRAKAVSGRRSNTGELSVEQGEEDDSSVATVFSLGGSEDACSLPPSSRRAPGLDRSVARYKAGRISASELKEILSEAFGIQVDCVLPEVLATLPARKRRELAKLWHINRDKPRQPKPFQTRASSGKKVKEEGSGSILGAVHFGTATAAEEEAAVAAAAKGTRDDHGLALHPGQAHSMGEFQQQQQQQQQQQRGASVMATRSDRRGAKGKTRRGGFGQPGDSADDDDVLGPFASKANSPFTTRASAWAGEKKRDPQEKGQEGEGQRTEGRDRSTRSGRPGSTFGEGLGGKTAAAANGGATGGHNGSGDDGDDDEEKAVDKRRKIRVSMESDAQRLSSEFAAGRLTAPHFFGAMMEEFGEKRLLAALPEILKILPEDKAADLKTFTSNAEGEAGARTKARRKEKEEEEKARKERERQGRQRHETDQTQAGEVLNQKTASTKESDKEVQGRKKNARKTSAGTAEDDAAKATEAKATEAKATKEDAQNDGRKKKKKKTKKIGDSADAKMPVAAVTPDQEKEGTKEAKPGKGKKLKNTEGGVVAGDDDVQGGELFEMTAAERRRYDKTFSKLSQDGGTISPSKAASTLAKSGLPRNALKTIWEIADVERDEQLNREEWAVAMHLVVCVTARKLPLPVRLPKCLRLASSNQQQPLKKEAQQRQQQQGAPTAEKKAEKGKEPLKQQDKTPKEKTNGKPSPPVDLKRATKEFKNGGMKAEEFLPVLQNAFGKNEVATMWPKLLPTLPPEKAEELAKVAGLNFEEPKNSSTETSLPRQVGLKKATASYKKGDMAAMEYHENVLKQAFGNKLPEMLPNILKALPPDRAAALKAVTEAEADELRRLAEEAPQQWAMSSADRRIYDNAFVKLDKDKDGLLSSTEAKPMLKKAAGDKLTESQIGDLWKMADIDGDNRLTREEWAIAFHIARCVIKRQMQLPTTLPEVLGPTAGGRLPAVVL